MNRFLFIGELRQGLKGLEPDRIDEMVADYQSHFDEGLAAGRSEEDIAAALGDPARLARELRAEAGFKRWEKERSAASLSGVVMTLLGLATVDVILMLPLLCFMAAVFIAVGAGALGMFVGGAILSAASVFPGLLLFGLVGHIGGALAMGLAGVGLIAGGVGLAALLWLAMDVTAHVLVRYARLHFRLIKSAAVE